MKYRVLGATGIRVSELILGAMTFGEQGGVGSPKTECATMLDAYLDAGGNTVDTAINYRNGLSEEILGEIIGDRRDRLVISSKYTVTRDAEDANGGGNHRKNLRLSLETSLRRLRTDHLDLYWVHIWDRFTPIEETMRALDDAVRAGKILSVGISDAPAWVISRGHSLAGCRNQVPVSAIQVPYSLVQREAERELIPMASTLGMSVMAWSPLAGGLLTGKFTRSQPSDRSRLNPEDIADDELRIARLVDEIADELAVPSSQVALAWTSAKSPRIHPIIGARTVTQLSDNIGSLDVTIPAELMARLDETTAIEAGFPYDFIEQTSPWVLGSSDIS